VLQASSAAQRGFNGWAEPGSLLAGEHPGVREGEELVGRAVSGMVLWAVRVQPLHPVAAGLHPAGALVAPRPGCEVQLLHLVIHVIHKPGGLR
jgi:hypothetical protein